MVALLRTTAACVLLSRAAAVVAAKASTGSRSPSRDAHTHAGLQAHGASIIARHVPWPRPRLLRRGPSKTDTPLDPLSEALGTPNTPPGKVLTLTYDRDAARTFQSEPGPENWQVFAESDSEAFFIGHRRARTSGDQHESIRKCMQALQAFFDSAFPNVAWWLTAGSLFGSVRFGHTSPWDGDGDINVENFNSEENWQLLLRLAGGTANARRSNGQACRRSDDYPDLPATTEGCLVLPLHPHRDVALVVRPEMQSWIGRAVDLRLGGFVDLYEVITKGDFARSIPFSDNWFSKDFIFPLRRSLLDGVSVNVPRKPAHYLKGLGWYTPSDFLLSPSKSAIKFHLYSNNLEEVSLCKGIKEVEEDTPASPWKMSFLLGKPTVGTSAMLTYLPSRIRGQDCITSKVSSRFRTLLHQLGEEAFSAWVRVAFVNASMAVVQ